MLGVSFNGVRCFVHSRAIGSFRAISSENIAKYMRFGGRSEQSYLLNPLLKERTCHPD